MEDLTLGELFAAADEVGNKYQTDEERQAFQDQLAAILEGVDLETGIVTEA